jgi:hypothetical protein
MSVHLKFNQRYLSFPFEEAHFFRVLQLIFYIQFRTFNIYDVINSL